MSFPAFTAAKASEAGPLMSWLSFIIHPRRAACLICRRFAIREFKFYHYLVFGGGRGGLIFDMFGLFTHVWSLHVRYVYIIEDGMCG